MINKPLNYFAALKELFNALSFFHYSGPNCIGNITVSFKQYIMNPDIKKLIPLLGLILFFKPFIKAQSDSILVEKLRQHSYTVTMDNKHLSNSGAIYLKRKAAEAHYFLIGEQHGIAEIPTYTASIIRAINALEYEYYASEIGPITAEIMADRIIDSKAEEEIAALLSEFPLGIPFYTLKNEAEVLEAVKEKTKLSNHFWGLDQEFILSSRLLLMELVNISKTETEKSTAQEYYDQALAGYQQSVEKRVPMVFLFAAADKDFERLNQVFFKSEKGLRIIGEMQKSQDIYKKLMVQRKGYRSNIQRANLLKQHFMDYYKQADIANSNKKVLIKLGAMHTYKGINPLGVSDIGNFIHEFATSKEQRSFHLYILPAKGNQNTYTLMSRSADDKNKAFDNSTDPAYASLIRASGNETRVFDLAPIRNLVFNKEIINLDEGLKRIIFGYDAILVLPEATAAMHYD